MFLGSVNLRRKKLKELAERQNGYFTSSQAAAIGYARYHHTYHVNQKNWLRILFGLFRLPDYTDSMEADFTRYNLWSRNLEDQPQGAISHNSALALHGFGIYNRKEIHMTVPLRFQKKIPDEVIIHKASLNLSVIESHGCFMATRLAQTLVDMRQELEAKGEWQGIIETVAAEGRLSREEMITLGIVSSSKNVSESTLAFEPFSGHIGQGIFKQNTEQTETRPAKGSVFDPVSEGVWNMMYDRAEVRRRRSKAGFTLVELLVVISIISILASMLLPVLGMARLRVQSTQCLNNQRQIHQALLLYAGDNTGFLPPVSIPYAELPVGSVGNNGWQSVMFPYLPNRSSTLTNMVFVCPTAATTFGFPVDQLIRTYTAAQTFAKNGPTIPLRVYRILQPSKSVLIGDGGNNQQPGVIAYSFGMVYISHLPSWPDPNWQCYIDLRHSDKINCLYGDGHASPVALPDINAKMWSDNWP
jgi:prepilin-type N-terminal cleavage/methylation domain-containing protein/prepilin-type processing-associated H-X9-DG protein